MYRFPYRQAGTNLHGEPIVRPVAPVRLGFGPNSFKTTALADSGAPSTIFARGTGDALLVRFGRAGAAHGTTSLLGKRLRVQFEHVDLCLYDEYDQETTSWEARVGFIMDPDFQMPFQGVLGDDGFFGKWAVTFNRYFDYFVIRDPSDVEDP